VERSSGAAPPRRSAGSVPLQVEVERAEDGISVVSLAGELDLATVPVAERPLLGELESEGTLIVDLTRLSFIDSSGIALLLQALRVDGGSRLCTVVARDSQVERVFRLAGIDRALALHFDRHAAVAALNAIAYGEADRVDSTETEDES